MVPEPSSKFPFPPCPLQQETFSSLWEKNLIVHVSNLLFILESIQSYTSWSNQCKIKALFGIFHLKKQVFKDQQCSPTYLSLDLAHPPSPLYKWF